MGQVRKGMVTQSRGTQTRPHNQWWCSRIREGGWIISSEAL